MIYVWSLYELNQTNGACILLHQEQTVDLLHTEPISPFDAINAGALSTSPPFSLYQIGILLGVLVTTRTMCFIPVPSLEWCVIWDRRQPLRFPLCCSKTNPTYSTPNTIVGINAPVSALFRPRVPIRALNISSKLLRLQTILGFRSSRVRSRAWRFESPGPAPKSITTSLTNPQLRIIGMLVRGWLFATLATRLLSHAWKCNTLTEGFS